MKLNKCTIEAGHPVNLSPKFIGLGKVTFSIILAALILSGCGDKSRTPLAGSEPPLTQSENTTGSETSETIVDTASKSETESFDENKDKSNNSDAKITHMIKENIGDNIAEILMISYDENQPQLEEYNYKNPEIDSLNNAIKFGVRQRYTDFINSGQESGWVEIFSYPFASDDFLQIVTTYNQYPTYGTDGELFSYNFDLKNNRFLSLIDVMEELNLTDELISERVRELYQPEMSSMSIGTVQSVGFLMKDNDKLEHTEILLEVVVENSEAEPWKHFFSYTPTLDTLKQLDPQSLFPIETLAVL